MSTPRPKAEQAIEALQQAPCGSALATVWTFCKREWGAADTVPAEVLTAYKAAYKALPSVEREIVTARVRYFDTVVEG